MRNTSNNECLKITETSEKTAVRAYLNKKDHDAILKAAARNKALYADIFCPERCSFKECVWTAKVKEGNRIVVKTERRYLCEKEDE